MGVLLLLPTKGFLMYLAMPCQLLCELLLSLHQQLISPLLLLLLVVQGLLQLG